jgi:peptidoglycan/LPS O-acetylase OafA/YrhL
MNGLRGLIALGVLMCHATAAFWQKDWWGPFAYSLGIGLMVFFAFSGFLLYRPYVAARVDGRPAPRVRDYTRRRALRILPAYWVALTLLAIWPGVPGVFGDHWWVYYSFLQIYKLEWMTGGLPQVWSLCIDVSFYAALPFYAFAMGRIWDRYASLRAEAIAVGLVLLGAFGLRLAASGGYVHPVWAGTLPGFMVFFGLGMALAVLSVAMRAGALPAPAAARIRRVASFGLLGAAGLYLVHATVFGVPGDLHTWELPLIGKTAGPFGNMITELTHQGTRSPSPPASCSRWRSARPAAWPTGC